MHGKRLYLVHNEIVRDRSFIYRNRKMNEPAAVAEFAAAFFTRSDKEKIYVISLDAGFMPMSIELIVVGSLNTASVEIGALYKGAILQGASCIIICHNHPLGKPEPSSTDATFTQEVKKAGDILRIPLVDHLVLGEDNTYYSFREEGKL